MQYPQFYDMYRDAIRNTWTVEEVDFSDDLVDLQRKIVPAERHLINRLLAFFATGSTATAGSPLAGTRMTSTTSSWYWAATTQSAETR